ncbi:MAG: UDP-3-O-acyl-N-acetylglucosamine deacetylase, partial [Thermodesulfobacteriota bacterium]
MEKKILIVDDEEQIVKSITGVFEDEGLAVVTAANGEEAVEVFQREFPLVTLLDIWMPGMDGIEVLKRMKAFAPDHPVIMLSGHATISTAMAAVKLGAFDFLEKPLSLDVLLSTVREAINRHERSFGKDKPRHSPAEVTSPEKISILEESTEGLTGLPLSSIEDPSAFIKISASSKESVFPRQRTLKKSVVLYGTGLHYGLKTGLLLQPLPPNSGILFGNVSSDDVVPLHVDFVETTEMATSLKKGRAVAKTIEHLMAVFHAYRITNLMVKMIEEIPIMDGSALEFCKLIEEAGIEEQEERVEELLIDRRMEIGNGNKSLTVEPAEIFSVHYFLDYPPPIGRQDLEFLLENEKKFKMEIAPARTFGFLRDMELLDRMGLGEGGRINNFILVDDEKIVNTELRFPDEFVRHKILDIIGDFYLFNRPIRGKITARRTGHTDNISMM